MNLFYVPKLIAGSTFHDPANILRFKTNCGKGLHVFRIKREANHEIF